MLLNSHVPKSVFLHICAILLICGKYELTFSNKIIANQIQYFIKAKHIKIKLGLCCEC